MRNGPETRRMIVEKSAAVFNRKGYAGSSMSDIMAATGLEKGGLYRHFQSKDELALEAFEFSIGVMTRKYREAAFRHKKASEKLLSVLSLYRHLTTEPPFEGGCPLLNTSVEADDTHPLLRQKAREAMESWLSFLEALLRKGIESGEFRPDLDLRETAVFLSSGFEGSIMAGKLFSDESYVELFLRQLRRYVERCLKA